eukprot:comp23441_c0_seq1/m.39093 comp23441_c0_seq1/g.39093  ORF comp23441_c0_seq1/g.39093 comp23441_c0_seq1/m.39093 type:complete len:750 (-) comp23441_c0_seq1:163-2412(-)
MFRPLQLLTCLLLGLLSSFTLSVSGASTQTPPSSEVKLGLRTLLLSAGPHEEQVIRMYLDGLGTPYTSTSQIPDLTTPAYHAIIVTSMNFNGGDFTALRQYAAKYNVRLVCLQSNDAAMKGTNASIATASKTPLQNVIFDAQTLKSEPKLSDAMNPGGSWAVNLLSPMSFTIPTTATPLLRYGNAGPVAAFIAKNQGGSEEMHFGFRAWAGEFCPASDCPHPYTNIYSGEATGEFSFFNLALANVWFNWATRGVYLGQRRIRVQIHIDDWFRQYPLVNGTNFRVSGASMRHAAQWTAGIVKKTGLPADSYFRFELAFNGAGHTAEGLEKAGPGSLAAVSNDLVGSFNWISHTWTHTHMDWLDVCPTPGGCRTPADRIAAELQNSVKLATGQAVPNNPSMYPGLVDSPAGQLFGSKNDLAATRLSLKSMVTPEISGLYPFNFTGHYGGRTPVPGNKVALKVMLDNGIKAVTGDNTRPELVSWDSPHHPIITTVESHGIAGMAIIPRHAPAIAYHTCDPTTYMGWYNSARACDLSSGPKCENRDYSLDEAIERQATTALSYLLHYRQDPFMAHQANMHACDNYNTQGAPNSLATHWVERILTRMASYINRLPVQSPKFDDTAANYLDRLSRDQCGLVGQVTVLDGHWSNVSIRATGKCNAALTVLAANELQPALPNKETYGPDNTYRVLMDAGDTVIFPLVNTTKPAVDPAQQQQQVDRAGSASAAMTLRSDWLPLRAAVLLLTGVFFNRM